MRTLLRTWLPLIALIAAWTAAWFIAWRRLLLERLGRDPEPLLVLFENMPGDERIVWVACLMGFGVAMVGVAFLFFGRLFATDSRAWSRFWLAGAIVLIAAGMSSPALFPSRTVALVDEGKGLFAMESRWLYAFRSEELPFDELSRVDLRVRRTTRSVATGEVCLVGTGLSLIRREGPALRVPGGFDHEAIGRSVAEARGRTARPEREARLLKQPDLDKERAL